jgi:hypothetical protein
VLPDEVFAYYADRGHSSSGRINVAVALRKRAQAVHAWARKGYVPWASQLEIQSATGGGLIARREDLPVALGGSLTPGPAAGVSDAVA